MEYFNICLDKYSYKCDLLQFLVFSEYSEDMFSAQTI